MVGHGHVFCDQIPLLQWSRVLAQLVGCMIGRVSMKSLCSSALCVCVVCSGGQRKDGWFVFSLYLLCDRCENMYHLLTQKHVSCLCCCDAWHARR